MSEEAWYWSSDEERWGTGPFETRDEALADGRATIPWAFFTGKARPIVPEDFEADVFHVLDRLGMEAQDLVGDEVSNGWPDPTPEDRQTLQAVLNLAVRGWIREYAMPDFFGIEAVMKHPAAGDDGDL